MDSTSSSIPPSSVASSPKPMHLCGFCHKPFLKETAYKRHVSYCRHAHSRPRTRCRSCRACSVAKAKCSFQPSCMRCSKKGIECIYDYTSYMRQTHTQSAEGLLVGIENSPFAPETSIRVDNCPLHNAFTCGEENETEELQIDMNWDSLELAPTDIFTLPSTSKGILPSFQEPDPKTTSHLSFLDNRQITINNNHTNFSLQNYSSTILPWSTSATQNGTLSSASTSPSQATHLLKQPTPTPTKFLTRLPTTDPVSNFTANTLMQILRSFPQMMLRRETLPPFIHGHWYRSSSSNESSLPESLVNCMGIAQVFASPTTESQQYLWRTIKNEQRSFLEKQDFSKEDLLAAAQAHMLYIIMLITTSPKSNQEFNLEMLITQQILCTRFKTLLNQPFCQDERLHPSNTWEEWIFAESRRRTILTWYTLFRLLHLVTNLPCSAFSDYRSLPLSSPKTLWEAKTREEWTKEYNLYYNSQSRVEFGDFGDLIDAHKHDSNGENRVKLDAWNAKTDGFGLMLGLGTALA